ncbi:DUF4271 domain-containing protein [Bacteroidales bacterium OttesenSCG-928-L14]|nr:DUF4271 domain-containing protein [Bacteroidales bacterium OttesenSCG-928-L14]
MTQQLDSKHNIFYPINEGIFSTQTHELFPSILLFVSLIIVTLIIFFFRKRTLTAFKAMVSPAGMNIFLRDGSFFKESIAPLMFLVYICSCSLFYYEFINYKNIEFQSINNLQLISFISLIVILLPILKIIIGIYLAYIFKCKRSIHQMLIISSLYNFSAGLLLIPILFIAMYSDLKFFFYVGLWMLVINYMLCFARILILGFSDKKLSNIYFIIYLCTLKILPVASIVIFAVRSC